MTLLTLRRLTLLVVAASASYICICVIWSDSAYRHRREEGNIGNTPGSFIPGMHEHAHLFSEKVPYLPHQQGQNKNDVAMGITGNATDLVKTTSGATKQRGQNKRENAETTASNTTEHNGQKRRKTAKTAIPAKSNTPKENKIEKPTPSYTKKIASNGRDIARIAANSTHQSGNEKNEFKKTTANTSKQKIPQKVVAGKTAVQPGAVAPTKVRPSAAAPTTVRPGAAAPTTVRPGAAAPTTVRPGAAAPIKVRPGAAVPTTVRPGAAAPTTVRPGAAAPITVRPGAAAPTTVRPGAAGPITVRPGAAAPTTWRPDGCDGCFFTDFPVLLDQSDICHGRHNTTTDVVFLVASAVTHTEQRTAIRETWASITRNNTAPLLRHVFIVGTTRDAARMRLLEEEARHFRDVVVVDFHDSYMNLTLKTLASLRWVSTRCKNARFFVKLDDDVWVNTPAVVKLLTQHSDFLQHGLGGTCATSNRVNRNFSKWPVPVHLHPAPMYAPYCYGFAYAAAVSVAEKVVAVSRDIPFFHVEDAYVGMCLRRLRFEVKTFKGFRNFQAQTPCKNAKSPKLSTILNSSPKRFYQYWTQKCS